jgi:hypothetical protein
MADKRARYTGGSETGVTVKVPLVTGEYVEGFHIPKGGELPVEINGVKVDTAFRDGLLEQVDNWSLVNRATGSEVKPKTAAVSGKDGE